MMRKKSQVISSHNWCPASPHDRTPLRALIITALTVRLRPACWLIIRAATPSFRNEETLLTVLDFNSLRSYNGANG
jgi:hypothetical protein